jgi:hypothetical protein
MKPVRILLAAAQVAALSSCRGGAGDTDKPVATPSVTLGRPKAPLGSPIDITYKFAVAPDAPPFKEDYHVFVGVVDADEELMWTDDHEPPTPTTQWKPGQTVEYTRTVFIPVFPYIGDASIHMGLYSTTTQKRLTLTGDHVGQRAYQVAKLQLVPQTENVFTVFKDGWHPAEVAEHNASVEWQWTKKAATLAFRNPKKDSIFYLDADNPGSAFRESQQVQLQLDGKPIEQITFTPGQRVLRKVPLTAAQLGSGDMVELQIDVDKTFVPALLPAANSKDPRELGIRVFHAFVQ